MPEHLQVKAGEKVEFLSGEYVYAQDCRNPERCGWIPTEVLMPSLDGELCEVKANYDNAAAGYGDLEYLVVRAGEQFHARIKFPTYVKVVVCADHKRKGWIPMAFLLNDPYDKPPPPTEAPTPRMLPMN